jgi:hypothetical protein
VKNVFYVNGGYIQIASTKTPRFSKRICFKKEREKNGKRDEKQKEQSTQ